MSALWNAVVQRIAFWGRAMSVGARWTWDVLDKAARIFAVVAFLAVSVGGVLLHQPAAVIGGVLGALAVFSFAEGTYRVWSDTETRAQATLPEPIGLSLLDRLRPALKRGQGFQDQADQVIAPDADFVDRVRGWHDDIHKTLIADDEREEAQRWLVETPAIPESSRPVIGGLSAFPYVLKQQVKCLEEVISRLEARDQ